MIEHVRNLKLGFSRFVGFVPKPFKLHEFDRINVIGSLDMIGICYNALCHCCLVDSDTIGCMNSCGYELDGIGMV